MTKLIDSRRAEFLAGVRAEMPILLGVAPFGMIYGVLAVSAGLPVLAAQGMSSILFAGSAQFIAAGLIAVSTPAAVVITTVFFVNLRHALYSASLAPHVRSLHPLWKVGLAYLLTDEAYAVAIARYARRGESPFAHWYFLGAGLTLWSAWQLSTAAGIYLGAQVPASWSLDFTLSLTFIALVMPLLTDRAALAAALVGGLVAVLAFGLPLKLGLIVAALAGIVAGMTVDGL